MLRTGSLLLGVLAPLLLASGCILGCSGYSGYSDRVFQNGDDQLILCSDDFGPGYVAMANGSITLVGAGYSYVDGSPQDTPEEIVGTLNNTMETAFVLYEDEHGNITIPALAAGVWTELHPDPAELTHYDYYCEQLPTLLASPNANRALGDVAAPPQ